MPDITLRFIDETGTRGLQMPDIVGPGSLGSTLSDVAGGTFNYLRTGLNADLLEPMCELVLLVNKQQPANAVYICWDFSDDHVRESQGTQVRKWVVKSLMQRFDQAIIGPEPSSPLALVRQFPEIVSVGQHFVTFLAEAKARGALLGGQLPSGGFYGEIDIDFGIVNDSNGEPWPSAKFFNWAIDVGDTMLAFIRRCDEEGVAEFFMQGHTLRAFIPGTSGVDRTVGDARIHLARSIDLVDGPVQAIGSSLANSVFVLGDAERFMNETSLASIDKYGIREAAVNARGVLKPGQLTKIGEAFLDISKDVRRKRTYRVLAGLGHDARDKYDISDWINIRDGGAATKAVRNRVRGIITTWNDPEQATVFDLDVSTRIDEREIELHRTIEQLMNAKRGPKPNRDTMPPKAPGWPGSGSVTASLYDPPTDSGGARRARLVVNWDDVTEDADDFESGDLAGYMIHWRYSDAPAWGQQDVPPDPDTDVLDSTAQLEDLSPGKTVYLYVTAYDRNGNHSAPSSLKTQVLPTDRGSWRTYDVTGDLLMDTYDDEIRVFKTFTVEAVDGGGGAPTGPGIGMDSAGGLRTFGTGGVLGVWAKTDGDMEVHGSLDVDGPATFSDTLDVGGVSHLGGALFLDAELDAQGNEISGGKFSTPSNGVVIEDATMILGANTISYTGATLVFSGGGAFAAGLSTSSTLDVTGTTTLNGALNASGISTLSGNVKLGGAGNAVGFYGSSGAGFSAVDATIIVTLANATTVINSIRTILKNKNLF